MSKNENDEWENPADIEIYNNLDEKVAVLEVNCPIYPTDTLVWKNQNNVLQYNENNGYYIDGTFSSPASKVGFRNIDTSIVSSKLNINKIYAINDGFQLESKVLLADDNNNENWRFYNSTSVISTNSGSEVITVRISHNCYEIKYYYNTTTSSVTTGNKTWIYVNNVGSSSTYYKYLGLYDNENEIAYVYDYSGDNYYSSCLFSTSKFNLNISWMTFN